MTSLQGTSFLHLW